MKPFYRKKGTYKNDKRSRIVIQKTLPNRDVVSKALPKPEVMWEVLEIIKENPHIIKMAKNKLKFS